MSKYRFLQLLISPFLFIHCYSAHASMGVIPTQYPFYIGISGGYGSTTWQGLVPKKANQNAIKIATPKRVTEGGYAGGIFLGYEFNPFFALEAGYNRYPDAKITFNRPSLFTLFHHGVADLNTHTEIVSLMAKIMLIIPYTYVRAFSSAGVADIHRYDAVADVWRLGPTFSIGLNYNFNEHVMGELAVSYTGGYGEAEINPSEDFVPFMYAAVFHLAYRF